MIRLIIILLATCLLYSQAMATSEISLTQGRGAAISIAINKFAQEQEAVNTDRLLAVIKNDLDNSYMFSSISPAVFIDERTGIEHQPIFAAWQQIDANLLLNGQAHILENGKTEIKFILWDCILQHKLLQGKVVFSTHAWRAAAHKIADQIYHKLTYVPGYFSTKIVYVSEDGPYLKRRKRLAIMDYDGANHRYLTDGTDLVLTPRFSPDGKQILYLSYKEKIPKVFLLDLTTNKHLLLGDFPGMSFAPRFSPDGKYVLVSIATDGKTHIYEINLATKQKTQLTFGDNINTSPSYAPDGKQIVFNSDRDNGRRHLYIMNRDGSNQQRITFGNASYAEPEWSKLGYIVFTRINADGFNIGVTKPVNQAGQAFEWQVALANSQNDLLENPSWAPNGKMIVFTKTSKPSKKIDQSLSRIYIVDVSGQREILIPTPHDASDPNWSEPR